MPLPPRPFPMSPRPGMPGQQRPGMPQRMDPRAMDQQLAQKERQLQGQLKQVRAIRTLIQAKTGRQMPGR